MRPEQPSPRGRATAVLHRALDLSLCLLPLLFVAKGSWATSDHVWILGFYLLGLAAAGRRPRMPGRIGAAVLALVASVLAASAWQIGAGATWREGKHFLYGAVLFFVLVDRARAAPRIVGRLSTVLVLAAVFLGLDAFWQWIHGTDVLGLPMMDHGQRATAVFAHANYLALFLCAAAPLPLYAASAEGSRLRRVLGAAAFVWILAAAALTETRSAWIALLLVLLVFSAAMPRRALPVLLGACLVSGTFVAVRFPAVEGRIAAIFSGAELRPTHWEQTLQMIRGHWVLGMGLDTFKDAYRAYNVTPQAVSGPHCFFLEVWQSAGVLALAALLWLLGEAAALFGRAFRRRGGALFAGMAWGAALVASGINIPFFSRYVSLFFWLLLGLFVAADEEERRGAQT